MSDQTIDTQVKIYTPEMLLELIDDDSKSYELHHGALVIMPLSGDIASELALEIARFISNFVREYKLGRVTGADGGYVLSRDPSILYAPDVGYVAKDQAKPRTGKFYEGAPDLAVEVVSPNDRASEIHTKVQNYLRYGTRLIWVVYPDTRTVDVHVASSAHTLTESDTLDGGEVLVGFRLPVRDIFAILDE